MNWIEQLLHVDPDGGNGSLEMLLLVAVVALLVAVALFVYARGGAARERLRF